MFPFFLFHTNLTCVTQDYWALRPTVDCGQGQNGCHMASSWYKLYHVFDVLEGGTSNKQLYTCIEHKPFLTPLFTSVFCLHLLNFVSYSHLLVFATSFVCVWPCTNIKYWPPSTSNSIYKWLSLTAPPTSSADVGNGVLFHGCSYYNMAFTMCLHRVSRIIKWSRHKQFCFYISHQFGTHFVVYMWVDVFVGGVHLTLL